MNAGVVVLALAVGALLALACETPALLTPSTGPGTSYPCGVTGVSCAGHLCCPHSHVCGGARNFQPSCPEGACCYVGDDWPGSPRGQHRPNVSQVPE